MPVKIEGILNAEEMLLRLDSTAKKRVVKVLVKRAEQIRDTARDMAPRDEGNLEQAIQMRGDMIGRARDEFGRFQRTEVEVYIDTDMEVPERPGKTVGDYAYEIHEHLAPAGSMQLGEESIRKQASVNVTVGGGFLDRAVDAVLGFGDDPDLVDILREL